jgi:hypothetical protein
VPSGEGLEAGRAGAGCPVPVVCCSPLEFRLRRCGFECGFVESAVSVGGGCGGAVGGLGSGESQGEVVKRVGEGGFVGERGGGFGGGEPFERGGDGVEIVGAYLGALRCRSLPTVPAGCGQMAIAAAQEAEVVTR